MASYTSAILGGGGAAGETALTEITSHTSGGASKHDATEVDYERTSGSRKNIQPATADVEGALTDLDDALAARSGLATTDKTTFVAAINEVRGVAVTAIQRAGTVAFTANQSMGGNKLTSLAAATTAGDAVRYEQWLATIAAPGWGTSVNLKAATEAEIVDSDGGSWLAQIASTTTGTQGPSTFEINSSGNIRLVWDASRAAGTGFSYRDSNRSAPRIFRPIRRSEQPPLGYALRMVTSLTVTSNEVSSGTFVLGFVAGLRSEEPLSTTTQDHIQGQLKLAPSSYTTRIRRTLGGVSSSIAESAGLSISLTTGIDLRLSIYGTGMVDLAYRDTALGGAWTTLSPATSLQACRVTTLGLYGTNESGATNAVAMTWVMTKPTFTLEAV